MGVSSNAKRATRVCAALIAGPISSLSFDGTLVSITIPLGFFAVSLPAPVYYDELERGRALQLIGSGPLHREGHLTVTVTWS
jgi:hypothetical protein